MKQQSQTQQTNNDDSPKIFNDVLKSLGAVLSKLYEDHSTAIIVFTFIILLCIFLLFRTINVSYLYSIFVTSLFILFSIGSYIKEKSFLIAITSFSLGLFTAFTVTWNGSTFSIFFVSFIILIVGIFLVAAIKGAATKEELMTRAANFYLNDFATNKKTLEEVDKALNKLQGALPLKKKYESILFFSHHKVLKDRMIALLENLSQVYAITKIESEMLLILFKNVHLISRTDDEFLLNKKLLEMAFFKGEIIPQDLVDILNATMHIAMENDIKFGPFVNAILTCSSHGYSREHIVEEISKRFIKKAP